MENQPLSHFGRYEILGELGRGAMGVVYQARDPQIDRLVAIKTISILGQDDQEEHSFRQRFLLEARAAGRLSHPGIVTIFDVGEDPQTHSPFIIMEYVAGETLHKILTQKTKLPFATSLWFAQQLAEALDYAHTHGVVHRDMKPANIIITEDGRAKITDFGIAKLNLAQLTLAGHALGTPAYMAPEQLEGERVDGRADLFSLGVILYAMLTGHRPFQGNSAATVSFKVVNRDPVPATAFDADFPPDIDHLITRAMAKDPAQRYQAGSEMALDLEDLLHGRAPRSIRRPISLAARPTTSLQAIQEATTAELSHVDLQVPAPPDKPRSTPAPRAFLQAPVRVGIAVLAGLLVAGVLALIYHGTLSRQSSAPPQPQAANAAQNSPPAQATPQSTASVAQTPEAAQTAKVVKTASLPHSRRSPLKHGDSTLQVEIEHHFRGASFSVWVDDQLALSHSLEDSKKRLVVFGDKTVSQSATVHLPHGKHLIGIRVNAEDGYSESQTITADFNKSASKTLHVQCERQKLTLAWQ